MSMKAEAKKEKIITDLVETRRKILDAASALSPAEQDEVFLGIWSVKGLLAHLAGWDDTNREAVKEILAGKTPSFYDYYDHDWRSYNARLVAEYKKEDFCALCTAVEQAQERLIGYLRTVPAEEWDRDKGVRFKGYKVTIARLLQVEANDEKTHYAQVEEFRKTKESAR